MESICVAKDNKSSLSACVPRTFATSHIRTRARLYNFYFSYFSGCLQRSSVSGILEIQAASITFKKLQQDEALPLCISILPYKYTRLDTPRSTFILHGNVPDIAYH